MQRYVAGLKLHWAGYQNCIRFKPVLPMCPIQLVDACYFLYSSKPLAYVLIWCPVLTPCLILTDAFQMSLYYIIMRHVLYLAVLMQLLGPTSTVFFWRLIRLVRFQFHLLSNQRRYFRTKAITYIILLYRYILVCSFLLFLYSMAKCVVSQSLYILTLVTNPPNCW